MFSLDACKLELEISNFRLVEKVEVEILEDWKCGSEVFYDETFFLYQKDATRNVAVKADTQKLWKMLYQRE